MATRPLLLMEGSNFVERISASVSSAESLFLCCAAIRSCNRLEDGFFQGVPFRTLISELYDYTLRSGQENLQTEFIKAVTTSLLNRNIRNGSPRRYPKPDQVNCIRRIIYNLGDTILLAKTGYGKSIVFQAVSVIRNRHVTIQVIPLSQLGEEQVQTVSSFPWSNPILVDQTTPKVCLFYY